MISVSSIFRISCQSRFKLGVVGILLGGIVLGAWSFSSGGIIPALRQVGILSSKSPLIAMTVPPALAENKKLLLSYDASDNSGIREIALRVTPHDPLPGANNIPVEISLSVPVAKRISRTDSQDLTSFPWAGQSVTLQIVATNEAGKKGTTDAIDFTLPERRFFHPIARVLIEERKKLMQHPEDDMLREEAANIMASIAHEPDSYRRDPVVLMALRSGAVRLVLGHDRDAAISVNDILWQAAARIEDGSSASSQRTMRDPRRDLARD
jgi:hypothetical protein